MAADVEARLSRALLDNAELRAALNDARGERLVRNATKSRQETSRFELVLHAENLPDTIDPRDTLIKAAAGAHAADTLFRIYKSPYYAVYSAAASPFTAMGIILGICGIYSVLGWASVVSWPDFVCTLLLHNMQMLRKVMRTFGFVALVLLISFIFGVWIDAVHYEAPRVLAVVTLGWGLLTGLLGDARRPVKKTHGWFSNLIYLGFITCGWTVILLYCEHGRASEN